MARVYGSDAKVGSYLMNSSSLTSVQSGSTGSGSENAHLLSTVPPSARQNNEFLALEAVKHGSG